MMRRWLLAFVLFAAAGAALAGSVPVLTIYHEADCPSVDVTRMKRMKRAVAETMGLVPAADCHPNARVRYLGVGPAGYAPSQADMADAKTVRVRSYTKADGTVVDGYWRRPSSSDADGKTVSVSGYTRANGTVVEPYRRRPPQR